MNKLLAPPNVIPLEVSAPAAASCKP